MAWYSALALWPREFVLEKSQGTNATTATTPPPPPPPPPHHRHNNSKTYPTNSNNSNNVLALVATKKKNADLSLYIPRTFICPSITDLTHDASVSLPRSVFNLPKNKDNNALGSAKCRKYIEGGPGRLQQPSPHGTNPSQVGRIPLTRRKINKIRGREPPAHPGFRLSRLTGRSPPAP